MLNKVVLSCNASLLFLAEIIMIVQDNEDIQRQIKKLAEKISDASVLINLQELLVNSISGEIDAVDEVTNFDNQIFHLRKIMFDSKIELERIQKAVHKHVAHTLNPIEKTAPKKAKNSARKEREHTEIKLTKLSSDDNVNMVKAEFISKTVEKLEKNIKANTHSTISRKKNTGTIPIGNAPKSNPAHDDDKPF